MMRYILIDFLGINYYFRQTITYAPHNYPIPIEGVDRVSVPRTAMGWEIHPETFTKLLIKIHNRYRPRSILITENGSAWDDSLIDGKIFDKGRIDYLRSHLDAIDRAKEVGVPIDGYFAWSKFNPRNRVFNFFRNLGVVVQQ